MKPEPKTVCSTQPIKNEMKMIGLGFPKYEADRAKLRRLSSEPLPAIYKDGVDKPCTICGVMLNVGPRVNATGFDVYCPICATLKTTGAGYDVITLNNPDSKPETNEKT